MYLDWATIPCSQLLLSGLGGKWTSFHAGEFEKLLRQFQFHPTRWGWQWGECLLSLGRLIPKRSTHCLGVYDAVLPLFLSSLWLSYPEGQAQSQKLCQYPSAQGFLYAGECGAPWREADCSLYRWWVSVCVWDWITGYDPDQKLSCIVCNEIWVVTEPLAECWCLGYSRFSVKASWRS